METHVYSFNIGGAIQANISPEENPLAQAATVLGDLRLDTRERDPGVMSKIDVLVAELTRLMEIELPENRDRTMAIPHNLTNSASGMYNNTVDLEQEQLGEAHSGELGGVLPILPSGNGTANEPEPSRIEAVFAMDGDEEGEENPNDNTDDVNFLPSLGSPQGRNARINTFGRHESNTREDLDQRILEINSPG